MTKKEKEIILSLIKFSIKDIRLQCDNEIDGKYWRNFLKEIKQLKNKITKTI